MHPDEARTHREVAEDRIAMLESAIEGWEQSAAEHARERAETIAILRGACADYGDNDWPDDLWLPDVIEKHLLRHLDAEGPATSPAAAGPPSAPEEPPGR